MMKKLDCGTFDIDILNSVPAKEAYRARDVDSTKCNALEKQLLTKGIKPGAQIDVLVDARPGKFNYLDDIGEWVTAGAELFNKEPNIKRFILKNLQFIQVETITGGHRSFCSKEILRKHPDNTAVRYWPSRVYIYTGVEAKEEEFLTSVNIFGTQDNIIGETRSPVTMAEIVVNMHKKCEAAREEGDFEGKGLPRARITEEVLDLYDGWSSTMRGSAQHWFGLARMSGEYWELLLKILTGVGVSRVGENVEYVPPKATTNVQNLFGLNDEDRLHLLRMVVYNGWSLNRMSQMCKNLKAKYKVRQWTFHYATNFLQKNDMSHINTWSLFVQKFPYFEKDVWVDQWISTLEKVRGNRQDLDNAKPDERPPDLFKQGVVRMLVRLHSESQVTTKVFCLLSNNIITNITFLFFWGYNIITLCYKKYLLM